MCFSEDIQNLLKERKGPSRNTPDTNQNEGQLSTFHDMSRQMAGDVCNDSLGTFVQVRV